MEKRKIEKNVKGGPSKDEPQHGKREKLGDSGNKELFFRGISDYGTEATSEATRNLPVGKERRFDFQTKGKKKTY